MRKIKGQYWSNYMNGSLVIALLFLFNISIRFHFCIYPKRKNRKDSKYFGNPQKPQHSSLLYSGGIAPNSQIVYQQKELNQVQPHDNGALYSYYPSHLQPSKPPQASDHEPYQQHHAQTLTPSQTNLTLTQLYQASLSYVLHPLAFGIPSKQTPLICMLNFCFVFISQLGFLGFGPFLK